MPLFKNIFINLFCFTVCLNNTVNIIAQSCAGSWALQRPATIECVTGQWVGWQNSNNPVGCPTNPTYTGTESNTFTFSNPVNAFSIDFIGFDGAPFCARLEIKVNDIFYPLTALNLSDFPANTTCTLGSLNSVSITPEGYIIANQLSFCRGRISITNVNTLSVTVSTNDGNGTVFSNPFNCTIVPLKLESFTVQNNDCKALLNWKTGIEQNVKIIEIQRSIDGTSFNKVGELNPKGSDSKYSFETANSSDGFFRLKIIDLDGSFDYSKIIYIKSSCSKNYYSISPNPASDKVKIIGLKNNDQLLLSDMSGRILINPHPYPANEFNIQSLPSGIYILQVFNKGHRKASLKLIRN